MPIIDARYSSRVSDEQLRQLARSLPHAVSVAVACPEEPYDHDLRPGDVELRFQPAGPRDVGELDVVIEVRSTWFPSRGETREERCDQICAAVTEVIEPLSVGVYLSLPVAAWSQSG